MKVEFTKIISQLCISTQIFLQKAVSRKFIVWAIATHMAYASILDSNGWLTISMLFMGAQTMLDWKHKPIDTNKQQNPYDQEQQ